jgi:hypothetical protein
MGRADRSGAPTDDHDGSDAPGFEPLPPWDLDPEPEPAEEMMRSRAPELADDITMLRAPEPAPSSPVAQPQPLPQSQPLPQPQPTMQSQPAPAYEPAAAEQPTPPYEPQTASQPPPVYQPPPAYEPVYPPAPPAYEPPPVPPYQAPPPPPIREAPPPPPIPEAPPPGGAPPWRAYEPGPSYGAGDGAGSANQGVGSDPSPGWESSGTRIWPTPVQEETPSQNGYEYDYEVMQGVGEANEVREHALDDDPTGAFPIVSGAAPGGAERERSTPGSTAVSGTASPEGGPGEKLAFVAAYPPAVVAGVWSPMLVVLHAASAQAAVDALLSRRATEFGGEPARSSTTAGAPVRRGTTLTLVPSVVGVEFNPPRLDVAWYEDVQEANFRLLASGPAGSGLYGAIEVFVGPLLVAVIPVGLRLAEAAPAESLPTQTQRAGVLDRIFVSYSRRDTPVVQACATVYRALGVQVLMDTVDLRSGQDWRESLHTMIAEADLFQLYWSSSSATSSEVEHEWRFARTLTDKGPSFIRPLYWESPMPEPPAELSTVHFSRMDMPQIAG